MKVKDIILGVLMLVTLLITAICLAAGFIGALINFVHPLDKEYTDLIAHSLTAGLAAGIVLFILCLIQTDP